MRSLTLWDQRVIESPCSYNPATLLCWDCRAKLLYNLWRFCYVDNAVHQGLSGDHQMHLTFDSRQVFKSWVSEMKWWFISLLPHPGPSTISCWCSGSLYWTVTCPDHRVSTYSVDIFIQLWFLLLTRNLSKNKQKNNLFYQEIRLHETCICYIKWAEWVSPTSSPPTLTQTWT